MFTPHKIATDTEMKETNSRRELFDKKCVELKKLLDEDNLAEAQDMIMQMVKDEYGEHCVNVWTLRYFLQVGSDTTTSLFDNLVKEYIEKETERIFHVKEKGQRQLPPVLTVEEGAVFQKIYNTIQKHNPEMNKNSILTFMASKTLENITE